MSCGNYRTKVALGFISIINEMPIVDHVIVSFVPRQIMSNHATFNHLSNDGVTALEISSLDLTYLIYYLDGD